MNADQIDWYDGALEVLYLTHGRLGETQSEDSIVQTNSAMFLNTEGLDAFEFLNSELLEPRPAFEGFGWAMDSTLRGIV